jgi:hypothetical protein
MGVSGLLVSGFVWTSVRGVDRPMSRDSARPSGRSPSVTSSSMRTPASSRAARVPYVPRGVGIHDGPSALAELLHLIWAVVATCLHQRHTGEIACRSSMVSQNQVKYGAIGQLRRRAFPMGRRHRGALASSSGNSKQEGVGRQRAYPLTTQVHDRRDPLQPILGRAMEVPRV